MGGAPNISLNEVIKGIRLLVNGNRGGIKYFRARQIAKALGYPLTPGILALIGMKLKELEAKGYIEIDIRDSKKARAYIVRRGSKIWP